MKWNPKAERYTSRTDANVRASACAKESRTLAKAMERYGAAKAGGGTGVQTAADDDDVCQPVGNSPAL